MATPRAGRPPEDYFGYIRDMLGQLAEMAGRYGYPGLERSIRDAAEDVGREAGPLSGAREEGTPFRPGPAD